MRRKREKGKKNYNCSTIQQTSYLKELYGSRSYSQKPANVFFQLTPNNSTTSIESKCRISMLVG